eukprot:1072579_1
MSPSHVISTEKRLDKEASQETMVSPRYCVPITIINIFTVLCIIIISTKVSDPHINISSKPINQLQSALDIPRYTTDILYKHFAEYCLEKQDICFYNRSMWSLNEYFDGRYQVDLGQSWSNYERKTWHKHLFYSKHISHWGSMKYNTTQCILHMNKTLIIPHIAHPQMLGEVWASALQYIFQYFVSYHFINISLLPQYNHYIGIMHSDGKPLFMFHDLLFKPFTNYPLMNVELDLLSPTTQCPICFKSMYLCGFNQTGTNLTGHRGPRKLPQPLKREVFISWVMRNWYRNHWISTSDDNDEKYHILIFDRLKRRQWMNVNDSLSQCNNGSYNFECRVIYAEHMQSPTEIIDAVSWSDLFIGVHGAGLVYALFQNENATVLELLPAKCEIGVEVLQENVYKECISPFFLRNDERGTPIRVVFESTPLRHAWIRLSREEYVQNGTTVHPRFWGDHNYVLSWERILTYIDYLHTHQTHDCGRNVTGDAPDGLFFGMKRNFDNHMISNALPHHCVSSV